MKRSYTSTWLRGGVLEIWGYYWPCQICLVTVMTQIAGVWFTSQDTHDFVLEYFVIYAFDLEAQIHVELLVR